MFNILYTTTLYIHMYSLYTAKRIQNLCLYIPTKIFCISNDRFKLESTLHSDTRVWLKVPKVSRFVCVGDLVVDRLIFVDRFTALSVVAELEPGNPSS